MTDPAASPIIVDATPQAAMWATFLRYAITALAAVLSALGYTGAAGKASALLLAVGPVAGLLAFLWGLWATYVRGRKMATMAGHLPDSVATTK